MSSERLQAWEEEVRALVVLAMQTTLPGVDLNDPITGYVSPCPNPNTSRRPNTPRPGLL
jgi:hypothetical protein